MSDRKKILVIPDYHAHPDYDNDRAELIGRAIVDLRPDVVDCLGDFADMPSLSSYDKGTKGFEGRRYKRDVEACRDALSRLHAPLIELNEANKRNHKPRYKPQLEMQLGNHEARINRAANSTPELHGTLSIDNLGFEDYGWRVHDFNAPVIISGICFSHYFPSGVAGRPIGGENVCATLIRKLHLSAVVGHNHIYDYAARTRPNREKMFAVSAGCFTHPDYVEEWCSTTEPMWDRGLVVINGAYNGYYRSLHHITLDELQESYG